MKKKNLLMGLTTLWMAAAVSGEVWAVEPESAEGKAERASQAYPQSPLQAKEQLAVNSTVEVEFREQTGEDMAALFKEETPAVTTPQANVTQPVAQPEAASVAKFTSQAAVPAQPAVDPAEEAFQKQTEEDMAALFREETPAVTTPQADAAQSVAQPGAASVAQSTPPAEAPASQANVTQLVAQPEAASVAKFTSQAAVPAQPAVDPAEEAFRKQTGEDMAALFREETPAVTTPQADATQPVAQSGTAPVSQSVPQAAASASQTNAAQSVAQSVPQAAAPAQLAVDPAEEAFQKQTGEDMAALFREETSVAHAPQANTTQPVAQSGTASVAQSAPQAAVPAQPAVDPEEEAFQKQTGEDMAALFKEETPAVTTPQANTAQPVAQSGTASVAQFAPQAAVPAQPAVDPAEEAFQKQTGEDMAALFREETPAVTTPQANTAQPVAQSGTAPVSQSAPPAEAPASQANVTQLVAQPGTASVAQPALQAEASAQPAVDPAEEAFQKQTGEDMAALFKEETPAVTTPQANTAQPVAQPGTASVAQSVPQAAAPAQPAVDPGEEAFQKQTGEDMAALFKEEMPAVPASQANAAQPVAQSGAAPVAQSTFQANIQPVSQPVAPQTVSAPQANAAQTAFQPQREETLVPIFKDAGLTPHGTRICTIDHCASWAQLIQQLQEHNIRFDQVRRLVLPRGITTVSIPEETLKEFVNLEELELLTEEGDQEVSEFYIRAMKICPKLEVFKASKREESEAFREKVIQRAMLLGEVGKVKVPASQAKAFAQPVAQSGAASVAQSAPQANAAQPVAQSGAASVAQSTSQAAAPASQTNAAQSVAQSVPPAEASAQSAVDLAEEAFRKQTGEDMAALFREETPAASVPQANATQPVAQSGTASVAQSAPQAAASAQPAVDLAEEAFQKQTGEDMAALFREETPAAPAPQANATQPVAQPGTASVAQSAPQAAVPAQPAVDPEEEAFQKQTGEDMAALFREETPAAPAPQANATQPVAQSGAASVAQFAPQAAVPAQPAVDPAEEAFQKQTGEDMAALFREETPAAPAPQANAAQSVAQSGTASVAQFAPQANAAQPVAQPGTASVAQSASQATAPAQSAVDLAEEAFQKQTGEDMAALFREETPAAPAPQANATQPVAQSGAASVAQSVPQAAAPAQPAVDSAEAAFQKQTGEDMAALFKEETPVAPASQATVQPVAQPEAAPASQSAPPAAAPAQRGVPAPSQAAATPQFPEVPVKVVDHQGQTHETNLSQPDQFFFG